MKRFILCGLLSCVAVGQVSALSYSDVLDVLDRSTTLHLVQKFVGSFLQALAVPAAIGYLADRTKTVKSKNAMKTAIGLQTLAKTEVILHLLKHDTKGGVGIILGHSMGSALAWYLSDNLKK